MAWERPRIAVILDENTSAGGRRYDMTKGYFGAVAAAGGLPFGIPYIPEIVGPTLQDFDGFLAVGGRFAYPDGWYEADERSRYPASDRLAVERALMEGFLQADKPVLGICAGMQMLACLNGCRLTPDLKARNPNALDHDGPGYLHPVTIAEGSRLAAIVGSPTLVVNTFHREAVVASSDRVAVVAQAPDGTVEAIEVPDRAFAVGLQWHQEAFTGGEHAGNRIFAAFVAACANPRPERR